MFHLGNRRFSAILLISMLALQALLTGLMFVFFYGVSRNAITQNFEHELALSAGNAGFSLKSHMQSLTARLYDISSDNSLRVALRLGMETKVAEIIQQKTKNSDDGMGLFLLTQEGKFIPEPEAQQRDLLRAAAAQRPDIFNESQPVTMKTATGFVAVLQRPLMLNHEKSLGHIFLTCNLPHIFARDIQLIADGGTPPAILIEKDQECFNLLTGAPVNLHAAKFLDDHALRPLSSPFPDRLYFAIPYTSLRQMTGDLLLRFVLFGVLSFAATTFLITLVIRKHAAALREMVAKTAALASDPGNRELPVREDEFREFRELTQSFNRILRDLCLSRDEVRQLNEDLEGRVGRRTAELSEANRLLQAQEQQLKQVVEHIPVATCMFDTQLNALYSSLMWNELFRLSVPQNQGKHFLDLIPEYREYWEKAFKDCMKGKIRHCSEKRMMIHGREYWLRWEAHPWADAAPSSANASRQERSVGGAIVFLEDITSHKWSQEALQRSADEAGIANRLKSEFLANVSHEIRTPLNCIIGFAEIISAGSKLEDIHRHAELILSESDTLLVLINDLLDFSKIEAGKLETDSHDFDLQQLFDDITPGVRLRLRKKPVSFSTEIAPEVPRYLHGDSFRLRQIIMNLVHNAVKFTEKGYIVLSATLNAPLPGGFKVLFSVEDSGIGIPADKQKFIFEKFTQADGSTTRRYGGTGLGTSISKKLAEIMGGSIGLKSVVGKGSTFWFTLPFTGADAPEQLASAQSKTEAAQERPEQPLLPILLTEDYIPNQMVARAHLESAGYRVEIANNGKEACALLQQNSYALVLMDLSMPEMDGYEATEEIRRFMGERHLPIIALTASAEPSVRVKCVKAGFDDILAKPIRRADLLSVIEKWIENAPSDAEMIHPRIVTDATLPSDDNANAPLTERPHTSGRSEHNVQTPQAQSASIASSQNAATGEETAARRDCVTPSQPDQPNAAEAHTQATQTCARETGDIASAPPIAARPADDHEPIDFHALQTDYPGKHSLIRRLLLQFYDILEDQIAQLERAVEAKDIEVLRRESHKLVGGAGTLRANRIFEAAKRINDAARDADFDLCAQEVSIIAQQRAELNHVLQRRYVQPESEAHEQTPQHHA